MAVRYRKYQNKNAKSATFGQWYGRAVVMDTISTKQLAEEISHSTTVTLADVMAVLIETTAALKRHLAASNKVQLDGLGSFRVGLKTSPADSSAEFGATNVSGYHIIYTPERTFNVTGVNENGNRTGFYSKALLQGISAKEAPKNKVED